MYNLLLAVFLGVQWIPASAQDMEPFLWLSGTWEMPRPKGGYQVETWRQRDSISMSGKGLRVNGLDTLLLETLDLFDEGGQVWYAPTVPDQNNGQQILFKLVSSEVNHYVFENPNHDFPNRIVYTFKPTGSSTPLLQSSGDTLKVDVTDLNDEGIHFMFTRK